MPVPVHIYIYIYIYIYIILPNIYIQNLPEYSGRPSADREIFDVEVVGAIARWGLLNSYYIIIEYIN